MKCFLKIHIYKPETSSGLVAAGWTARGDGRRLERLNVKFNLLLSNSPSVSKETTSYWVPYVSVVWK